MKVEESVASTTRVGDIDLVQIGTEIQGIAIAALGGAAVGVDGQRAYRENEPGGIGGVRTFTLLGTVAGSCGFLIAHDLLTLGV